MASSAGIDAVSQLQLRQFMTPYDNTVRDFYHLLQMGRMLRTEFTCEWFARPLLDFLQSQTNTLWIYGPSGCGKSFLYGWICDALRTSDQDYVILTYVVDPLLPSESSLSSLLKALLWQAYQHDISGLADVSDILAGISDAVADPLDGQALNEQLFGLLELAIQGCSRPIALVIDGLSELSDGPELTATSFGRLVECVSNCLLTRLIVLSQPFSFSSAIPIRRHSITPADITEDLHRSMNTAIVNFAPGQRSKISHWVTTEAKNFAWLQLLLPDMSTILAQRSSIPGSLTAIVDYLTSGIEASTGNVRTLLLMSIASLRPLTVPELQDLINLEFEGQQTAGQSVNVSQLVDQQCGSLMSITGGVVHFRHPRIRQSVLDSSQTGLSAIHAEMTRLLMLYLHSSSIVSTIQYLLSKLQYTLNVS